MPNLNPEELIQKISIFSRIGFLALSALVNFILPDHDSDGFVSPILVTDYESVLDKTVDFLFGGLCRWDGQHFYHVARYGYTYETNLAFFPLFPSAVGAGAQVVTWATGLNFKSAFLIVVVAMNTALFTKSALTLFRLTRVVFRDDRIAFNSALFFCFSPATVFFIAPYSETLFAFCTFNGMLAYSKNEINYACAWFCISGCARSNGTINGGFIAHYFFSKMLTSIKTHKGFSLKFVADYLKPLGYLVTCLAIVLAPFLIFQIDGFYRFCKSGLRYPIELVRHGERNNLLMPGDQPIWCGHKIPMPYSYVQDAYWDVGFLRYYTLKQIPNFCLAFPIVVIILGSCVQFLYKHKNLFVQADEVYSQKRSSDTFPRHSFVYIVHAVFLTVFCVLNINVQVTTRMLASSSPVLYWIASTKFLVKDTGAPPDFDYIKENMFDWKGKFHRSSYNIISYFVSYAVVGTVLFSNNLPWT
ncbi:GPI mannosyltransferase 2 [Cimex lectularius]|uniref:GPI mannosyltransferase 2 n=1 Tax=Cimex lectularius TaxID=79782 RepID=A0A8I6TGZ9_CIMLE|nr:GPI mannosyltransferase 2 [Cimex lectularius]